MSHERGACKDRNNCGFTRLPIEAKCLQGFLWLVAERSKAKVGNGGGVMLGLTCIIAYYVEGDRGHLLGERQHVFLSAGVTDFRTKYLFAFPYHLNNSRIKFIDLLLMLGSKIR